MNISTRIWRKSFSPSDFVRKSLNRGAYFLRTGNMIEVDSKMRAFIQYFSIFDAYGERSTWGNRQIFKVLEEKIRMLLEKGEFVEVFYEQGI